MRRYVNKRGFSDRLYFINFCMTWLFVWGCFIASLFSGILGITDLSAMGTAISCAFAELGIHTGFIIWKAKAENVEKHKKDMDIFNVV